jgi:putative addiction module component (TIGR02574 family)
MLRCIMDTSATLAEIRAMNIDDRIRLVQAIWDTIAEDAGQVELTEAQIQELERRLADDDANPEDVIPWETVKAEALARLRK